MNYCGPGGRDDSGTARMDAIARTALSIAEGDIVNVQIHRFRQWQHAQMGAFMSSVIPYVHLNLLFRTSFLYVQILGLASMFVIQGSSARGFNNLIQN